MDGNVILILICTIFASMIWIPWLWRYRLQPLLERKKLSRILKQHMRWGNIKETENFLNNLYKNINAKHVSNQECQVRGLSNQREFIYGEIQFLSFYKILDKVKPKQHEKFYDLGCGGGKAVFSAALFFELSQSIGIELLPGLCDVAHHQLKKAKQNTLLQPMLSRIQFINDNFLQYDFSDGDIIFINATALSDSIWSKLCAKLLKLKSGSRVIVTTKTISHRSFELVYQGRELMSWGMNSVNIYQLC